MSRARSRRLPVLRVLSLLALAGVWAVACGGPQPLRGSGSVCFRTDECQAGLACVPQTPGATKHVCSADLSGIVSMVDGAAPASGETPDAMGGASGASQAGAPSTAGAAPSAGAAGKPATGGAPGAAGAATSAGAASGGAGTGGAGTGGAATGGSGNGGAATGGAQAGTGG